MRKLFAFAALALACAVPVLVAIAASVALAQETAIPADDFLAPIRPYLNELISVLAIAFVGWLTTWLRSLFKVNLDEKHRNALHAALENGARLAMEKLDASLKDKKIDVGSPLVKTGLDYVLKYSPDAINYFGLSPERVREMLLAKFAPPPEAAAVAEAVAGEKK